MGNGDGSPDTIHGKGRGNAQSVSIEIEALITIRLDLSVHRVSDFSCARSPRIHGFFGNECPRFLARNYCRVFVLGDPDDPTRVLGFYTLSPGLVEKREIDKKHDRPQRVMPGLPIPLVRIGFLGRDDSVPKDKRLGLVLLHDAALRIHLCHDLTAWGLYLDAENEGLASWYSDKAGFKATNSHPLVMYSPLKTLLPGVPGLP
jgi:hypothetical protein